jgi:hypothetical protein
MTRRRSECKTYEENRSTRQPKEPDKKDEKKYIVQDHQVHRENPIPSGKPGIEFRGLVFDFDPITTMRMAATLLLLLLTSSFLFVLVSILLLPMHTVDLREMERS